MHGLLSGASLEQPNASHGCSGGWHEICSLAVRIVRRIVHRKAFELLYTPGKEFDRANASELCEAAGNPLGVGTTRVGPGHTRHRGRST